jgi:predicted lipoprotein
MTWFGKNYLYTLGLSMSLCSLVLSGCKDSDDKNTKGAYDQTALLTQQADALIIPRYQNWLTTVQSLKTATDALLADGAGQAQLEAARTAFADSYLAWQEVEFYEFGPAERNTLRALFNTFPTDTSAIRTQILNNNGALGAATANSFVRRGYPALDYLLYKRVESTAALTPATKTYIREVVQELVSTGTSVVNEWTSGNARQQFIQATGTNVGSSVGLMVNSYNFQLDMTKNARVGIPLGKKSLNTPLPDKVEGYYSKLSVRLLKASIQGFETFLVVPGAPNRTATFLGYLDHLEAKAGATGELLSTAIQNRLTQIKATAATLPDNMVLSEAVVSNQQPVDAVHTETQRLIVLTKSDMPSVLGVQITYSDNDGD